MYNSVPLVGRMGAKPELKTSANNDSYTSVSLATSEKSKNKTTGEIKDAPTAILVDENGEFFKNQSFGVTNFCATLTSGTAFKLRYIETRKSKTNAMRKVDIVTCYLETAS